MINDLGLLEIAQKAAQMEGVEALHINITQDGVIAMNVYSQPCDYSEKECMCSTLHLYKDESAKYNSFCINVFFKTIESWQKKNLSQLKKASYLKFGKAEKSEEGGEEC